MSDQEFSDWWVSLTRSLTPGMRIQRWSAHRKSVGSFVVTRVNSNDLVVDGPNRTDIYQRIIGASEFRLALELWSEYLEGSVGREELSEKHSTYVISLIHWLGLR